MNNIYRSLISEWLGTLFLLATVIGAGIMAENLAGGNIALALLGNTIPTGAILVVLISIFGPISGAHFNPAVTLAFLIRGEILPWQALAYVVVQTVGAICGALLAHFMFELSIFSSFISIFSFSFSLAFSFFLIKVFLSCDLK